MVELVGMPKYQSDYSSTYATSHSAPPEEPIGPRSGVAADPATAVAVDAGSGTVTGTVTGTNAGSDVRTVLQVDPDSDCDRTEPNNAVPQLLGSTVYAIPAETQSSVTVTSDSCHRSGTQPPSVPCDAAFEIRNANERSPFLGTIPASSIPRSSSEIHIQACRRSVETQRQQPADNGWMHIAFGQVVAFLAASQNMASYTLENKFRIVAPMFLLWHCYLLLSFHLLRRPSSQLQAPLWQYALLSALDVVPNYMVLLSLQYTSLTSATLLASLTVPSTMCMARLILQRQFRTHHYIGASLCILGGLFNVWSDTVATTSHPLFGDLMAVLAALSYGLADTLGEYCVKHIDRDEYLGMLGAIGLFATTVLVPLTEGHAVRQLITAISTDRTAWTVLFVMILYVLTLVLYYISSSCFLVTSDATMMNLSLQSASLWSALFSIVLLHNGRQTVTLYYCISVICVSIGVYCYEYGCGSSRGSSECSSCSCSCTNHKGGDGIPSDSVSDPQDCGCRTVGLGSQGDTQ